MPKPSRLRASQDWILGPRTLDDYIGQDRVRENLHVSIEAAKQRGEALDHVLLYGPPGLGKTTLASVIANELGVPMRATAGPVIEKAVDDATAGGHPDGAQRERQGSNRASSVRHDCFQPLVAGPMRAPPLRSLRGSRCAGLPRR